MITRKPRNKNIYIAGTRNKIIYSIVFAFFALYAVTLIVPLLIVFVNSFKSLSEYSESIFSLPKELFVAGDAFKHYKEVLVEYDLFQMFVNTIILTIGGTIVGVLFPCIVSFILAKYEFKFSGLIYTLAVVFMVVPGVANLTAKVKLFNDLNLMNSYFGMFILYAHPFGSYFFILYAYYKGLSSTYMEAAYIDGANDFCIFFKIILPMSKSGLSTVAIMTALNCWNDYFTPYMFMPEVLTLSTGLEQLSSNTYGGGILRLFAAMTCMTIPVLIAFFIGGKNMLENVAAGGIKE